MPANSPADVAGLLPYSDYILGTPEGVLHGESGLGELVEDHIGRPLRLYVYNNEYDVTREITIHPSKGWGGEGALGCTLGYGALHRLPAPLSEPVAGPGETLFEGENARFSNEEIRPRSGGLESSQQFIPNDYSVGADESNFLVPANVVSPPANAPPTGGAARKKGKAVHANRGGGLDDYFMEGEKKSREVDHAPSAKSTPPPPPPKSGPPPSVSPAPEPEQQKGKDADQEVE